MSDDAAAEWLGVQDEPEFFGVYPENWPTLQVFLSMSRQWRWTGGMESQRVALDHNVLPLHLDMLGISKKARKNVFACLQMMECAALDEWYLQQQKKKP